MVLDGDWQHTQVWLLFYCLNRFDGWIQKLLPYGAQKGKCIHFLHVLIPLFESYSNVFLRNSTRRWWGKPKSILTTTKSCKKEARRGRIPLPPKSNRNQTEKRRWTEILTSWGSTSGLKMSNKSTPCLSNSLVSSMPRTGTQSSFIGFISFGSRNQLSFKSSSSLTRQDFGNADFLHRFS